MSRRLGDEVVVLDRDHDRAHSLSGDVAAVWRSLEDGTEPPLAPAAAAVAFEQLEALGLVRPSGVTRRSVLKRGGIVAAGVGITSILLPEAIAAASTEQVDYSSINTSTEDDGSEVGYQSFGNQFERDGWAAPFTVGVTGRITHVQVRMRQKDAGSNDPVLVQVLTPATDGSPGGVVGAGSIDQANFSGTPTVYTVAMTPQPTVAAGQSLYVAVSIANQNTTTHDFWFTVAGSVGTAWVMPNGGAWSSRPNWGNLQFATLVTS